MAIPWLSSLQEGLQRGAEVKKPVLLDISAAPR